MELSFENSDNIFKILLFYLLLSSSRIQIHGAKILFFNGFASYSHLVAFEPLAKKLADDPRHQVTLLSPMRSTDPHPNITHFCPKSVLESQSQLDDLGSDFVLYRLDHPDDEMALTSNVAWEGSLAICRSFYQSPEFKEWLDSTSFDLIVIDAFTRECALPLAHKFKAKYVFFSACPLLYGDADTFGFPTESSWVIPFVNPYRKWLVPDSLVSEVNNIKWYLWRQWSFLPRFEELAKKELEMQDLPPLVDMERDAALFFVNTHFSSDLARSLPPNVIAVGGMHVVEGKTIEDKRIRDFVEDPKARGFIYMSYGSFYRVSAMPPEKLEVFLETMKRFPDLRFLWKWEGKEIPEGLPENVLLSKWLPQQDILGHPKCRGFVSQGGLMSLQQSVFHGIPLIISPFGWDQEYNAKTASQLGFAIRLEMSNFTVETFSGAIRDILENPVYKKKALEFSRISKDRPLSPVDTAVWWVEYILRHQNVDHLKSPGIYQTWWQQRLLHLWIPVIALSTSIFILFSSMFIKTVTKFVVYGKSSPSVSVKSSKQKPY